MIDCSKPILLDFGKRENKMWLAFGIICFSAFGFFFKQNEIERINFLPRNRTELTSIDHATLSTENGNIIANVFINYIYNITLQQHIKFINLKIQAKDNNITLRPQSVKISSEKISPKKIQFIFSPKIKGFFHIGLFRGKTLICESNITI